MQRRLHKILLYILILVISMPGLLYIYYEAARLHLHHTMEEAMERTHLQVLTIAADQLNWVREGKEILIEGRMFDVHTIRQAADKVIISGLFDDKEKWIKEKLFVLRNTENQESRSEQQIVSHWHRLQWVSPSFDTQTLYPLLVLKSKHLPGNQALIPSPYLQTIIQPPEILSDYI